jgi:hypothetical protein
MKRYIAKVYIPIVYEIYAETSEQAKEIALEGFERESRKEKLAFYAASLPYPKIEVEEMENA